MQILLSNDDGYLAPGLSALADGLRTHGDIVIVAPDRDRSGASNSLTLTTPLRVARDPSGIYVVTGTPTDCVHLGLTGLLQSSPDVVVSGINAGPNLGDDVIYSGTVAAAMEGRSLGLPAMAVSLALQGNAFYETAARAASVLLGGLKAGRLPAQTVLNVNVPDIEWSAIKGFQVTRLGHRHQAEPVVRQTDPRGNDIYWVGPPGAEQDAGAGTDFDAVRNGYVSVTPMHVDLTRHSAITSTSAWIEEIVTA
jgi:5'-nucleotidase